MDLTNIQENALEEESKSAANISVDSSQLSPEIKKAIDFVNSVIAKGEPFVDEEFPPCKESIYTPTDKQCDVPGVHFCTLDKDCDKYGWKRASDLFKAEDLELFKDGVDINDVKQQGLGDCYFLAALLSLAEVPERITDRFITKVKNDAGIYAMTFFVNGVETPVIVDDFLPTNENNPKKP